MPHCGQFFTTYVYVSLSSFPLRVPIQDLSFDGFMSFPQCMSNQFHFRLLICVDILFFPILLQSSSFEITSGQWVCRIRRKQRLTKDILKFQFNIILPPMFRASRWSLFFGFIHQRPVSTFPFPHALHDPPL